MWMPVGILAILAVTSLHGTITTDPHGSWYAPLAVAVTIGVHLGLGRRTIPARRPPRPRTSLHRTTYWVAGSVRLCSAVLLE
ncbi:hypothetical protein EDD99_0940 [Streptomyces sp. 846.5]|nr:hypothetical protein EDD99_0940 [Streptomyces sp. 846.5]